jgi:hypothetical protein
METGFHSLIVCLARNESQPAVKNRALSAAVEHRKIELIELLVRHGAAVVSVPFVEVLRSWDPRIMRFFLERGADATTGDPFAVAFGEKVRTSLRAFVEHKKANPQLEPRFRNRPTALFATSVAGEICELSASLHDSSQP